MSLKMSKTLVLEKPMPNMDLGELIDLIERNNEALQRAYEATWSEVRYHEWSYYTRAKRLWRIGPLGDDFVFQYFVGFNIQQDWRNDSLWKTEWTLSGGFEQWSITAGITAASPGVQGNVALTTTVNEVSTVANANDAVTLPRAVVGRHVVIINNGANILEIWPASGDNAGGGVNIAVTLASGSNVHYVAYSDTVWEQI